MEILLYFCVVFVICDGDVVVVGLEDGWIVCGFYVFMVVGLIFNSVDFGLEEVGVVVGLCGYIIVDKVLCINVFGIYVVGDCIGVFVLVFVVVM